MITNVVGLAAAVLGDEYYWWIDPAGAILLAIYTISNWSSTVMETAGKFFVLGNSKGEEIDGFYIMLNSALLYPWLILIMASSCSFPCWTICPARILAEIDISCHKASSSEAC